MVKDLRPSAPTPESLAGLSAAAAVEWLHALARDVDTNQVPAKDAAALSKLLFSWSASVASQNLGPEGSGAAIPRDSDAVPSGGTPPSDKPHDSGHPEDMPQGARKKAKGTAAQDVGETDGRQQADKKAKKAVGKAKKAAAQADGEEEEAKEAKGESEKAGAKRKREQDGTGDEKEEGAGEADGALAKGADAAKPKKRRKKKEPLGASQGAGGRGGDASEAVPAGGPSGPAEGGAPCDWGTVLRFLGNLSRDPCQSLASSEKRQMILYLQYRHMSFAETAGLPSPHTPPKLRSPGDRDKVQKAPKVRQASSKAGHSKAHAPKADAAKADGVAPAEDVREPAQPDGNDTSSAAGGREASASRLDGSANELLDPYRGLDEAGGQATTQQQKRASEGKESKPKPAKAKKKAELSSSGDAGSPAPDQASQKATEGKKKDAAKKGLSRLRKGDGASGSPAAGRSGGTAVLPAKQDGKAKEGKANFSEARAVLASKLAPVKEALASGRAQVPGDPGVPVRAGAGASAHNPGREYAKIARPHAVDVTRDTVRMRFPEGYSLPTKSQVLHRVRPLVKRLDDTAVMVMPKVYTIIVRFPSAAEAEQGFRLLDKRAAAFFSAPHGTVKVFLEAFKPPVPKGTMLQRSNNAGRPAPTAVPQRSQQPPGTGPAMAKPGLPSASVKPILKPAVAAVPGRASNTQPTAGPRVDVAGPARQVPGSPHVHPPAAPAPAGTVPKGVPPPSLPQGQPRVTQIGSSIPVTTRGIDPRLPRDPRTRGQPVASPPPQPNQAPAWTAPPVGPPAGTVGAGPGPAPIDASFGTGDLLAILANAGVPAPVAVSGGAGEAGAPVVPGQQAGGAVHLLGGPAVPPPFGGGGTDISTDFLQLLTKLQQ